MPRRNRRSKRRRHELTLAQRIELELGPNVLAASGRRREVIDGEVHFSVFASDAERRRAWDFHRDALLAAASSREAVPWAWHHYEGGRAAAPAASMENAPG